MKIKIITTLILGICLCCLGCKKKIVHSSETLQPSGNNGIDAFIYDLQPDRNLATHPDFMASAWTNGGIPVVVRSILKFDFSSIPPDATIDSVRLSLYSYYSPLNKSHSTLNGSNKCLLQKVISDWKEEDVTWKNQPSTTTMNQVVLPASQHDIQNYLNIDVTYLTKEMIKNSSTNFGFMIKLEKEEYFRSMVFASSDNANPDLHPKLAIYYTVKE